MLLGAHMSIQKGFAQAVQESVSHLQCNTMQIFLKSPRGGKSTKLTSAQIEEYQEIYNKNQFQFVVGHSSYLLNLAKPIDETNDWQFASLLDDFEKLSHLYGKGLVYHVGKYLKLEYQEAESHLVENLKRLLEQISRYKIPLLLENCAGQGTEMGTTLEQISSVITKLDAPELLGVCLDTCHAFAAGYDLSDPLMVETYFKQIEQLFGLNKVVCFHLNDSKTPLNSHRDRHENLGVGFIKTAGLTKFIQLANQAKIPLILETPLVDNSHLQDVLWVKNTLSIG